MTWNHPGLLRGSELRVRRLTMRLCQIQLLSHRTAHDVGDSLSSDAIQNVKVIGQSRVPVVRNHRESTERPGENQILLKKPAIDGGFSVSRNRPQVQKDGEAAVVRRTVVDDTDIDSSYDQVPGSQQSIRVDGKLLCQFMDDSSKVLLMRSSKFFFVFHGFIEVIDMSR